MPAELGRKKHTLQKNTSPRQYTWSTERRRFVRFACAWKIKFCDLRESNPVFHHGKCRDLSQGGMKLAAFQPLKRKSVVLIEIDSSLFSMHIKLNSILKVSENRILAEVAWRHLNLETGLFEAGLEFLEEAQRSNYLADIEKATSI